MTGLVSVFGGYSFLILVPGNKVRGSLMKNNEAYSGIIALVSRGFKVLQIVHTHFLIFLVVLIILSVYLYQKGMKLKDFLDVFIFTLAGLATSAVLILTPEPMPRAYFGAGIFFIIAVIQLLWMITKEENGLYYWKQSCIIAGAFWLFFSYAENGLNLARVLRETREREQFVAEEILRNRRDVTLPKLRSEFQTKYSYMFETDLREDKDWWLNSIC